MQPQSGHFPAFIHLVLIVLACFGVFGCNLDTEPLRTARDDNAVSAVDASTDASKDASTDAAQLDAASVIVGEPEPSPQDAQPPVPQCVTAADCPASSAECRVAVCRAGRCDEVLRAMGTPCGMGGQCSDQGACGECAPRETKCTSERSQSTCGSDGRWADSENCGLGCVAGRCAQCKPGKSECVDQAIRMCGDDGRWTVSMECKQGCGAGACRVCKPGESQCTDESRSLHACDPEGQWSANTSCPNGCADGHCRACVPAMLRCAAGMQETCGADGAWGAALSCGPAGCVGDHCGQCKPGATECVGDMQRVCSDQGAWGAANACPAGCSAGVCNACKAAEVRCVEGMGVQRCGDDRQWSKPMACAAGCDGTQCAECRNGSVQCVNTTDLRECVNKHWGEAMGCRPDATCDATPMNGNTCPCNAGFIDPHPNPGTCTRR